jgi:hypothetical protein
LYAYLLSDLDDNEVRRMDPEVKASNGDGDYTTRDEDEECYDIAQPGKPSFDHTIT